MLGAQLSRYLFIKAGFDASILDVSSIDVLRRMHGKQYLRSGRLETYNLNDLQSFTLARFWPEQNTDNGYIVVDPDVFPVDLDKKTTLKLVQSFSDALLAVPSDRKNEWRSSVMIRAREKNESLWNFNEIIDRLFSKEIDYNDLITLRFVTDKVRALDEIYNHYDILNSRTVLLHTTARITQPWRTGLPVDFVNHKLSRFRRLYSKYWLRPKYQKHPNPQVEHFFFSKLRDAILDGFISDDLIRDGIKSKNVRADIYLVLEGLDK